LNVKSRIELFVIAQTLLSPHHFSIPVFQNPVNISIAPLDLGQVMDQTAEAQKRRVLPQECFSNHFLSSHSSKSARKVTQNTEARDEIA
jgi:hypothetical protein